MEEASRPVLHVLVTAFHHQRGWEVEFAYPPIIDEEERKGRKLPEEWHHLPFVSLPEGAHNYEEDTVFFMLPNLEKWSIDSEKTHTVYGISCYRQINSKELKNRSEDVTRSTVQKSVCILCQLPLFGYIQTKLEVATRVYFSERDFSKTEILKELYKNLNSSLSPSMLDPSLLFVGLPISDLLTVFRQRVLVLFKLLLLERKVIFFGVPVKTVSSFVLALVSLVPGLISNGLCEAACVENYPVVFLSEPVDKELGSSTELNSSGVKTDQYGLPLVLFGKGAILHPYLSLQQMDIIKNANIKSYWIGASNVLYKQQRHISDVLVDLTKFTRRVNAGTIEIHDPELNKQLSLTTADLRFTDYLMQHVESYAIMEHDQNVGWLGWDGSEEWIRAQFKMYLFSLLSTMQHTDAGESMSNFNSDFIAAWRATRHYNIWNRSAHSGVDDVHAGHPFQGQMSIADVKIRLANTMQDVASKSVGRAVGGAINSARSYVASWLSDLTQEVPEEENQDDKPDVPAVEQLTRE